MAQRFFHGKSNAILFPCRPFWADLLSRRMKKLSQLLLIVALAALVAAPARAENENLSAHDFVLIIYAQYRGANTSGIAREEWKDYFSPSLMQLIGADSKSSGPDRVPNLDGDPFIQAQDWDIPNFATDVQEQGPTKAKATVTFQNQGVERNLELDLVKLNEGWRIDDIHGPSGSLRKLLKQGKSLGKT